MRFHAVTLQLNIRQFIHSFSDALDLVGIDEVQHGKRVAFMACECARAMDLSSDQIKTLYHAALLHDCGVSSTQTHRNLVSELEWSGSQEHCIRGERLLQQCNLLSDLSSIVRYHHTHWRGLPSSLDLETALLSNLIYLADRVDALIAQHDSMDILSMRDDILNTIAQYEGDFFSPELVTYFLNIAASEYFWLMLDSRHLIRYILEQEQYAVAQEVDRNTFLELAMIFAE
ncbi:MAG: HD domain-containing protein, partial [Candidatus Electrothrix sp. ATG2]|nr:HD domain-containing protein [Candidatus Electrothrix sp. ATG2]